jgi:hypothetical protein
MISELADGKYYKKSREQIKRTRALANLLVNPNLD